MESKKIITYTIGIIVIVILGVLVVGRNGGQQVSVAEASNGFLSAAESFYDFKMIAMKEGLVTHEFPIVNESSESVMITKVYTSCMCTTAKLVSESGESLGSFGMPGHGPTSDARIEVLPGEIIMVDAIFDPAAHGPSGIGRADRTIYLETNSSVVPTVELDFTATVKI